MTLRTYQAPTMAEALAQVKRDLGRDAVILQTRPVRRRGLMGLCRRRLWEVTASPSLNVPQRVMRGMYQAEGGPEGVAEAETLVIEVPYPPQDPAAPPTEGAPAPPAEGPLARQVQDIRRMVAALLTRSPGDSAHGAAMPAELDDLHSHLLAQDVEPETAGQLIQQVCLALTGQQLADPTALRQELRGLLCRQIAVRGAEALPGDVPPAGRARIIALIGPTGVGKTTTVAKLAANYKLHQHKRVGLTTMDTYRIAAVEQLRTYAEIIDVPLQTVMTPGELHQAVCAMRDLDVVLIDTAGRSQNNKLQLSELRSFLAAAEADEVHLVISATSNRTCTRKVLDRFMPLGANRLIVTKLDEAETFGILLNLTAHGAGPISFVTTGQGVPDDICPADSGHLADCILAGKLGGIVHAA